MEFSKSIVTMALITAVFTGCKDTAAKPVATGLAHHDKKEIAVAAHPMTATFSVEGMTCAMGCAKTIEEKLSEMDGVQKAEVDFETKMATVNFDADKLKTEDLRKAIEACADGKTYKAVEAKAEDKG